MIREFQRLKYASENSIRQISGFVLLLMLMPRVFSIAYAYVTCDQASLYFFAAGRNA